MVELVDGPIPIEQLLLHAQNDACGATVVFLGTTRRWTGDTETAYLEYEAYREMALAKLAELEAQALQRWPIKALALVHRLGKVDVKEASVAVVVSTPHRVDAFEAGKWLIDELKSQVPIWKKEWFLTQSPQWIHPTPTEPNSVSEPLSNKQIEIAEPGCSHPEQLHRDPALEQRGGS